MSDNDSLNAIRARLRAIFGTPSSINEVDEAKRKASPARPKESAPSLPQVNEAEKPGGSTSAPDPHPEEKGPNTPKAVDDIRGSVEQLRSHFSGTPLPFSQIDTQNTSPQCKSDAIGGITGRSKTSPADNLTEREQRRRIALQERKQRLKRQEQEHQSRIRREKQFALTQPGLAWGRKAKNEGVSLYGPAGFLALSTSHTGSAAHTHHKNPDSRPPYQHAGRLYAEYEEICSQAGISPEPYYPFLIDTCSSCQTQYPLRLTASIHGCCSGCKNLLEQWAEQVAVAPEPAAAKARPTPAIDTKSVGYIPLEGLIQDDRSQMKSICPRCNGDGAFGACRNCGGNGFA